MAPEYPRGTEPKTFIGRIESVDRHSKSKLSRFTFVIDAVDEGFTLGKQKELFSARKDENFSLIRVMTTFRKFSDMATISEENPENLVGQWLALSLVPHGSEPGPLAQVCTLGQTGYETVVKYTVGDIRAFGEDPESPRTLSAAGDSRKQIAARLASEGRAFSSQSSRHELIELCSWIVGGVKLDHIKVLDVGHANFTTVFDTNHKPVFHFDVGWPVGFNMHTTVGRRPSIEVAPIVILSHWDWDHLHGYHIWKALQSKNWVAPIQDLGPGALRVALDLKSKGKLTSLPAFKTSKQKLAKCKPIVIGNCNATHAKTKSTKRNNSGLFLGVQLASSRFALLPGDADYQGIVWPYRKAPDLLVVSHHGAAVIGAIQRPQNQNSVAVISMGKGNVYRHPCKVTLKAHQLQGWKLVSTSKWNGVARGDWVLT